MPPKKKNQKPKKRALEESESEEEPPKKKTKKVKNSKLSKEAVEKKFSDAVMEKAQDYFDKGNIQMDTLKIVEGPTEAEISAKCTGSAKDSYPVRAVVLTKKGGFGKLFCGCQVGRWGKCKHIAALLLAVADIDWSPYSKKKAAAVASSPAEKKKVKAKTEELEELKLDQLKSMLRANQQPVTGTKPVLIEKIADGMVRGALPKCPECYGGFLTHHEKDHTVTCKGYFDDDEFVACAFSGTEADIERTPWKGVEEEGA